MKVDLQYGKSGLSVDIPAANITLIQPRELARLPGGQESFNRAVASPIASKPLHELVGRNDRVAIVIPDMTRPLPSRVLLPWLLQTLSHVPEEQIVIINGTGSHRASSDAELAAMVGRQVFDRIRVVNHDAFAENDSVEVGQFAGGASLRLNRHYVDANRRILLGFIEPHFIAGFSGGYKAIIPGIVDIASIMHFHRAVTIGDPRSTWGLIEGNPTQQMVRAGGAFCPADFCINVTLNRQQEITGYFCGSVIAAHDAGCRFVRDHAMVACEKAFPIVVTTNAGYPLDLNLYQTVKGMSAAAQIVSAGGLILAAAECIEGFPEHGHFRELMHGYQSPRELLDAINAPGFELLDQWEAQLLAMIQLHARVGLKSNIPDEEARRAFLEPVDDIGRAVAAELGRIGRDAPVAVLPCGFMSIPYIAQR